MNPFLISGYISPDYFCDREEETGRLLNSIHNSRNITLISERRLGKTGLLKHVETQIEKETVFIYIDLYSTLHLHDFIFLLSNEVLKKLEPFTEKVIKKITGFFGVLRPKFSFDPQSGAPSIEFSITSKTDADLTVSMLFEYIRQAGKKVTVAFDEFQQILKYPEKNMEALLRTEIQKDATTCFIFCGSQTHLLISIFNDYARPFYQSTEILFLGKIEEEKYAKFILAHFEKNNTKISIDTAKYIYELNHGITYNVQYMCNKLYSLNPEVLTPEMATELIHEITTENEIVYYNYRELVTELQYNILKAVAKEEAVEKPFSNSFIKKYKLGSTSSVKSGIDALVNKGILIYSQKLRVTDLYFSLWLKKQL